MRRAWYVPTVTKAKGTGKQMRASKSQGREPALAWQLLDWSLSKIKKKCSKYIYVTYYLFVVLPTLRRKDRNNMTYTLPLLMPTHSKKGRYCFLGQNSHILAIVLVPNSIFGKGTCLTSATSDPNCFFQWKFVSSYQNGKHHTILVTEFPLPRFFLMRQIQK